MNYAVSRCVNYYDECDKDGKLAMRYFRCERDWLFYCVPGYSACSIP